MTENKKLRNKELRDFYESLTDTGDFTQKKKVETIREKFPKQTAYLSDSYLIKICTRKYD